MKNYLKRFCFALKYILVHILKVTLNVAKIRVHVYMYICIYVYIYIYTYIHALLTNCQLPKLGRQCKSP